ncbi:MAG TPA: hypothetical protein PLK40_00575 [Bacteroidaceae bacterium]|nr:hypothetical protein [Bacteroidaceae bacterium]
MNLIDIIELEERNKEYKNRIYLYLSGNIWRAYEQSARLLKERIPEAASGKDVFPYYEVELAAAYITLELIIQRLPGSQLMVRDSYIEIRLDEEFE